MNDALFRSSRQLASALGACAYALATMLTAALIGAPFAAAQDKYPSRPVKIIQTLPAGTSPDIRARIIAEQLTKMWGQQVVVENRPGGGGAIGVQAVLSAPADGYTLLAAATSTFTILPVQKDKPPVDVNRDLVPIGITSYEGLVIAVSPKLGVNTLADLIALAKRDPHKIIIGTNAAGTLPHLAARLLVDLSKAPITVLPYATGGTNQAIADILGGRVHVVIESRPGLKGALELGRPEGTGDHVERTSSGRSGFADRGGNHSRSHCGRLDGTRCAERNARGHNSAAEPGPPQGARGSRSQDTI